MSENIRDHNQLESNRETFADAFGKDLDPLQQHASTFKRLKQTKGVDPMEMFRKGILANHQYSPRTRESYRTTINQWQKFMNSQERHYACPNTRHVNKFIDHLRSDRGNVDDTVKNKLWMLNKIFESWQRDDSLPHSRSFNPFLNALERISFDDKQKREFHPITHSTLAETLQGVHHTRDLAIILLQLKLGSRASEVCNIKLKDVHLVQPELQSHYPQLGTSPFVDEHPNSIVIPSSRTENKSANDRVMPIDDELRLVLTKYLTIRPDADSPYLLLSKTGHTQMGREAVNDAWKKHFPERYTEDTEQYRGITSHFGRHWFTTYWSVDNGFNRELVRYMRGDAGDGEAMDEYIHVTFEQVQDLYLDHVRKFLLYSPD